MRLTRPGIAFKPRAVYILESNGRDEGIEVIVQQWEITKTVVASQKIEHQLRVFEAILVFAILVAHAGEIWSMPVRMQAGLTYALKMHAGVLT